MIGPDYIHDVPADGADPVEWAVACEIPDRDHFIYQGVRVGAGGRHRRTAGRGEEGVSAARGNRKCRSTSAPTRSLGKYEHLGEVYELDDYKTPSDDLVQHLQSIIDEAFGRSGGTK